MLRQLAPGNQVVVVSGCPGLNITKGAIATVVRIDEFPENGRLTRVELAFFSISKAGRSTRILWANHINRLSDETISLHEAGSPKTVRIIRVCNDHELPPSAVAAYDQMLRNLVHAAGQVSLDPESTVAGQNLDGACQAWLEARESVQRR